MRAGAGTGAEAGTCTAACRPPPAPPRFPRDCFAAGTCVAGKPSEQFLHDPTETHRTVEVAGPAEACGNACVSESLKARLGPVAGTTSVGSAGEGDSSAADLDTLIQAITGIGQPDLGDTGAIITSDGGTVTEDNTPQPAAAGAGAAGRNNNGGSCSPNKGDIGTQRLIAELKAKGYKIRGTEISAEAANGVNVRFDVVAERGGLISLYDAKNGSRAMFTKNQGRRGGYASIESSGGTWTGGNAKAVGLSGSFGPTDVNIAGYGGYPYTGLCR